MDAKDADIEKIDDKSGENEPYDEEADTNELEDSLRNRKKTEEPVIKDIKQCLTVSKKIILFGAVIPGQIKEQRLLIENFSSEL